MRIYSNYSQSEFSEAEKEAKELGMTLSSFQKYCLMLYVKRDENTRNNALSLPQLIAIMKTALNSLKSGDAFIISSLFSPDVWTNLSASDKRTLGNNLKSFVKANPKSYSIASQKRGRINLYKKI
jgi:hypothetical protein